MTPIEPAIAALAFFALCGVGSVLWRPLKRRLLDMMDARDRAEAIRLHRDERYTHGQIAQRQFRDPAQIAQWLAEADSRRAS